MNVLKIISTPIKLPIASQCARLESRLPDPKVGIVHNPGRLNMKSDHIKVDTDTPRSRGSLGFKTTRGLIRDAASAGLKAAPDTAAQYSRVGNQMMQIQDEVMVFGIIRNQVIAQTNVVTGITFIPPVGPDISWGPANLSIGSASAQLALDPQVRGPATRYVPGELSINTEQYPKVEMEYTGGPIYAPPSTNPVGNKGPQ